MAIKVVIEETLWSLECKYRDALYTAVDEYKQAGLNELSYIINSNMTFDVAKEKLHSVYEVYLGKLLGVDYMFNKMLDEETNKRLNFMRNDKKAFWTNELKYAYGKHLIRLDDIYKNN